MVTFNKYKGLLKDMFKNAQNKILNMFLERKKYVTWQETITLYINK